MVCKPSDLKKVMGCCQGLCVGGLRRMLIGPCLICGSKVQPSPVCRGDRVWCPSCGAPQSLHLETRIDKQPFHSLEMMCGFWAQAASKGTWVFGQKTVYKPWSWISLCSRKWGWEPLPPGWDTLCGNCSCSLFCTKQISVRSTWCTWTVHHEKLGRSLLQFVRLGLGLPLFGKTWQFLFCVGKQKGLLDAYSPFQHSFLFAVLPWVGTWICHLGVLAGDPPVTGATSSRYRTCIILHFCFMFSNQNQSSNYL